MMLSAKISMILTFKKWVGMVVDIFMRAKQIPVLPEEKTDT